MKIIKAKKEFLSEMIDVINDSIINLCKNDHQNSDEHINNWLTERSLGNLEAKLFHEDSQAFICIEDSIIIGVVLIEKSGTLQLCYVHSEHAGKGVGRILLAASENQAREWGLNSINMVSTGTARDFYRSHGYLKNGDIVGCIGMPGYPLIKNISNID